MRNRINEANQYNWNMLYSGAKQAGKLKRLWSVEYRSGFRPKGLANPIDAIAEGLITTKPYARITKAELAGKGLVLWAGVATDACPSESHVSISPLGRNSVGNRGVMLMQDEDEDEGVLFAFYDPLRGFTSSSIGVDKPDSACDVLARPGVRYLNAEQLAARDIQRMSDNLALLSMQLCIES